MANPSGLARGEEEEFAVKRLKAFELRRDGKTYRAIAAELGISAQTACNYVCAILEDLSAKTLAEGKKYIEVELERLDQMLEAIRGKANEGDLAAQEMVLKIQQRRSKYLGLDAPEKKELTGEIGLKDLILRSMNPDDEEKAKETKA